MMDDQTPAPEAGDEVMADEAVFAQQKQEREAPEGAENTEGQEQDPPAEPEGDETPEGEDKKSPSQLRRERRKAEMERLRANEAEARRKAQELEQKLARLQQVGNTAPPKPEQFGTYDEYLVAMSSFNTNKVLDDRQRQEVEYEKKAAQQQLEAIQRQAQAEIAQSWQAQTQEARARYADFDQVVNAPDLPIPDHVAHLVAATDHGADIAYHLGTHRQEAERIARMNPLEAAMAIGALSARISLPKPRQTTTTPDPIAPVSPKGTARKNPANMTMAEYKKWRASQA